MDSIFSHTLSRYQSSIGTTNVGTDAFGPTLLVQSISADSPSDDRSVVEFWMNGNSLFEVRENGSIGILESEPKATLDINGYARLKVYSEAPVECDADHDGSISLTSKYTLCVCKSDNWVHTNDGSSTCEW